MIKGFLVQLEAEFKLGYNGRKMGPETNTNQGGFAYGRRLFSTWAKSAFSQSARVKSAFCEPVHRTAELSANCSGFPLTPSVVEANVGHEDNLLKMNLSNCVPYSQCSLNLKKYRLHLMENNTWFKRVKSMPECMITGRCTGLTSAKEPVMSANDVECSGGQRSCQETRATELESTTDSSHSLRVCAESDSDMDSSQSHCEGFGVVSVVENHHSVGGVDQCSITSHDCPVACQMSDSSSGERPQVLNTTSKDDRAVESNLIMKGCDDGTSSSRAQGVCSSRRKKTRPSAKKRHRRRRQRGVEDHVNKVAEKIHDQSSAGNGVLACDDVKLFVIDFQEDSDADSPLNASVKAASSPPSSPVETCSLFISARDLSDGDEFTTDNFKDCSFDDDEIDFSIIETSSFLASPLLSGCHALWQTEVGCLTSLSTFDESSCDGSDDHSESNDELSLVDPEMRRLLDEANKKWEESYGDIHINGSLEPRKVRFPSEESILQTVFTLSPDDDYRQARIGKWEEYARDRQRFNDRINETERVIGHCLESAHRAKVYHRLYEQ